MTGSLGYIKKTLAELFLVISRLDMSASPPTTYAIITSEDSVGIPFREDFMCITSQSWGRKAH